MKRRVYPFAIFSWAMFPILALSNLIGVNTALAQIRFNPPKLSAPGNREAGAARSDTCAATAGGSGLMAILPTSNLGLTTKAQPTIFAYIPPNNGKRLEFRLIEEKTGQEIYIGQVQMPMGDVSHSQYKYKASLVGASLPSKMAGISIEPGKNYYWAFMLVCNDENRAEDIVISGSIQRASNEYIHGLEPSIQAQLNRVNAASPQEQIAIYSSAGIWYDLIEKVATLMTQNPTSYSDQWLSLLKDQGLGAIANTELFESPLEPIKP